MTAPAAGVTAGPAVPVGPNCQQGETMACACADGISVGTQSCQYNETSPTRGTLGPCERCMAPAPAMTATDAAAAAPKQVVGAQPDAGVTLAAGSNATPMCVASECPEVEGAFGIMRAGCCTEDNACGSRGPIGNSCQARD